jgi:hypothetical protein
MSGVTRVEGFEVFEYDRRTVPGSAIDRKHGRLDFEQNRTGSPTRVEQGLVDPGSYQGPRGRRARRDIEPMPARST